MEEFYKLIFKRKSFHIFKDSGKICSKDLEDLEFFIKNAKPLNDDIQISVQIVPEIETTCKRGAEYCILFYSEKRDNYLQNIGYIGEQIDLYLASKNIGALWFGIGKPVRMKDAGLDFVIMIGIAQMPADKFRKDMFKAKRKPLYEIWSGDTLGVGEIARFAPSACNTQPWIVEKEEDRLLVYRYKKPGKRGIMPAARVAYYNRIDMGIFQLILEICLVHEGWGFERILYMEDKDDSAEKVLTAEYRLTGQRSLKK